jgi:hypothetical protein
MKSSACRRGDSTHIVRWCLPLSFLCLKSLFLSMAYYCCLLMFSGVAVRVAVQHCSCTAMFDTFRVEHYTSITRSGRWGFLLFAGVRVVLARRLHRPPVFTNGCCQSLALLSHLGSSVTCVKALAYLSYNYKRTGFISASIFLTAFLTDLESRKLLENHICCQRMRV